MGSYINMGIITKNSIEEARKLLLLILNKLQVSEFLYVQYSTDEFGENWCELKHINKFEETIQSLFTHYYGEAKIMTTYFNGELLPSTIWILKEKGYICILIGLEEDKILNDYSISELKSLTNVIICFMVDIFQKARYIYGFCDQEAYIEDLSKFDPTQYSISFVQESGGHELKIIENAWHIDGLTPK